MQRTPEHKAQSMQSIDIVADKPQGKCNSASASVPLVSLYAFLLHSGIKWLTPDQKPGQQ